MTIKSNKGFYQIKELLLPGLIHGFSTKQFGNMGYQFGPKYEVDRNRLNFGKKVGINTNKVGLVELVHGAKIVSVDQNSTNTLISQQYLGKADGMITNNCHVALLVSTADCAPFLFFDPNKKIVGLAHVGKRGAELGLPLAMIKVFEKKYGSNSRDIVIAIGPTICQTCYGLDFVNRSLDKLRAYGVIRIYPSEICNKHSELFYSHRAEREGQKPARFATVIQMT